MSPPVKPIEQIAKEDGRYPVDAFQFVRQGLHYAIEKYYGESDEDSDTEPRHITGRQLCQALRALALRNWGSLARSVLQHWHLESTRDFGEIVYLMVESGWMQKQPSDTIEDFDGVYDFRTAFNDPFAPELED